MNHARLGSTAGKPGRMMYGHPAMGAPAVAGPQVVPGVSNPYELNARLRTDRQLTWWALAAFGVSVLGSEWHWAISQPAMVYLFCKAAPTVLLVVLCLFSRAFELPMSSNMLRMTLYMCVLGFSLQVVLGSFWLYGPTNEWWVYGLLMQAVAAGFLGYRIGTGGAATVLVLKTLARASAVVSVLAFFTPEPMVGSTFPVIHASYPIGVFVWFGLCWYTVACMVAPRLRTEYVVGLLACCLEAFAAFHKPIVLPGVVSLLVTIIVVLVTKPKETVRGRRVLMHLTVLGVLALTAAITIDEEVSQSYVDNFYKKYLHKSNSAAHAEADYNTVELAAGGRFPLWQQGIESWLESPWLGNGFSVRFFVAPSRENVHNHNGYIELLYSLGVVGFGIHAVAACIWFRRVFTRRNLGRCIYVTGPVIGYLAGFATYNVGGSSLVFYTFYSFTTFLMGIALAQSMTPMPVRRPQPPPMSPRIVPGVGRR